MKPILITALMLLAAGSLQAQKTPQYDDDIYGVKPVEKTRREEPAPNTTNSRSQEDAPSYSSSGSGSNTSDNRSNTRQYSNDEYYDSDDDSYYAARINRFNHPFYNRPYWSTFNNPYWYDPFWVDPYWGYSPWTTGPGLSISIGAGPYWSSYWGWSSWYGNPYFGSYYNYPSYGYGGYYSGYWNSYYAGVYGNNNDNYYRRGQTASYGPRYSLRPTSANAPGFNRGGYSGFRSAPDRVSAGNAEATSVRNQGFRPTQNGFGSSPVRSDRSDVAPIRNNNEFNSARGEDRPARNGWNEATINRGNEATTPQSPRAERSPWVERSDRAQAPARTSETPRIQEQRSFQQTPRAEQPRNTESAPARTFDRGGRSFGGERSGGGGFGGGRSSGGGGGNFGGGGGHRR